MATWRENRDYMLEQEAAGTATDGHKDWLARWRESGSPINEAGMMSKDEYAERMATKYTEGDTTYYERNGQLYADTPTLGPVPVYEQTSTGEQFLYTGANSGVGGLDESQASPSQGLVVGGTAPGEGPPPQPTGDPLLGDDPFLPPSDSGLPPPVGGDVVPWEPELSASSPSWSWDYFKPKEAGDGAWGGYDADYGVFERYQPGQDSPWGMPDVEGGNEEFYQQQFNNLLRDEQDYRTRQRASQLRADENAQQEPASIDFDDMWASMGYTPNQAVQFGGEDADYTYTPNTLLGDDFGWNSMSDQEIFSSLSPSLSSSTQSIMSEYFNDPNAVDGNYWSSFTNPTDALASIGQGGTEISPEFRGALSDVFNTMFTRTDVTTPTGGGPTAAPGYALPI